MVELLESFSLGKRTQFGMMKMRNMNEAWSLVKEIKGNPLMRFDGQVIWATKSFPQEERSRTQGTRRAVRAIRKACGPGVDIEVDYSKLQVFVGDYLVGKADVSGNNFEFDSEKWDLCGAIVSLDV
eukprot:9295617-Heterocapsa_arctica.AAC.1